MAYGRRTVRDRLRRQAGVTPFGLARPALYSLLYDSGAADGFGRSRSLHCPHHVDGGPCGIWAHRCAMCATWFCKYDRGAVGRSFWQSLHALLKAVEKSLAQWCVLESGIDLPVPMPASPGTARRLDRYELDRTADPERYGELWGRWEGREEKFFQECARRVEGLGWSDVTAKCGPEVRLLARTARRAFGQLLERELPDRLRVGEIVTLRADPRAFLVASYNGFDPLSLPRELVEALPWFDGRPVVEALQAIQREKKVRLESDLVLRLVDFGILVPARGGR